MRFVEDECYAAGCKRNRTHVLEMRVTYSKMEPFTAEYGYCLEHVIYFAGWLPYCYPGEQELVSITPPASELFPR